MGKIPIVLFFSERRGISYESAGGQSKTIGMVLKKTKNSIDKITRSTENVMNKFEAIDSIIRVVSREAINILIKDVSRFKVE